MRGTGWAVRKPAVRGDHGLVASQNALATAAGADVLGRGGNAVDAAVTTALMLSVVEPWLSGIGGGGFLLWADGRSGAARALDFNMRAPAGIDPADYPLAGDADGDWFGWPAVVDDRNLIGHSSICVPGAVDGLATALAELGTISWAEALEPAIRAAEDGLRVDWYASMCIAIDASGLARFPESAALFLEDGRAPRAGEGSPWKPLPMPRKAALIRRLAEAGPREFYEGETARAMAADLAAGGSALSYDDLAGYRSRWLEPMLGSYRDHEVLAVPGLSAGPTLLDALGRLAADPRVPGDGPPDAAAALAYAEAIRGAYADRLATLGHAGLIPPGGPIGSGSGSVDAGCTTHVSVVDRDGSMVALTNTLLSRFGSKVVLPSTGCLMNNGMMWFDPRPGRPNSIAAGRQPLANMCPTVLRRDGTPWLAIGAAGGRQIFPTVLQLVSYLLDRGLDLEEAFHTPRLDGSTPTLRVNAEAPPTVAAALAESFPVDVVEDTLYPVIFAIPSAVRRIDGPGGAGGRFEGMAHPPSPWAGVAAAAPPGGPA